jgi:hypothetical protein
MIKRVMKFRKSMWIVLYAILIANITASAGYQEPAKTTASAEKVGLANTVAPSFKDYRGARIGMTATEVREKLGKPKRKDKTQDLFVFGENELAQIFYDDQEKVYAISIDFTGKNNGAPTAKDVLGEDITAREDGSIYQRKQYQDAGYWLSYNRTSGDEPQVTITMQKIPN